MDGGGEETLEEEVKGGKRRNIESRYPGWALFIEREREALKCIVLTNGSRHHNLVS